MWDWLLSSIHDNHLHAPTDTQLWHARLMFAAWGVIAPIAILIARFCKVLPSQDWPRQLDNRFWWRCHWIGQTAVLALSLGAAALVMNAAITTHNLHGTLGFGVLLLVCSQVVLGLLRGSKGGPDDRRSNGDLHGDHYAMTRRRRMFEQLHKSLGYLVLLLAAINILTGLWAVNAPRWMWLTIALWWGTLIWLSASLQQRGFAIDTYQAIFGPDPEYPGNQLPPAGWGMQRPAPRQINSTTSELNNKCMD